MSILKANINASIADLLCDKPSGVVTSYLIKDEHGGKLASMVSLTNDLANSETKTFIEVKFKSKYSQREKRLEIVTMNNNHITICKISNPRKFDKDALEINNVCQELEELYKGYLFAPIIYLPTNNETFYQDSLNKMGLKTIVRKL